MNPDIQNSLERQGGKLSPEASRVEGAVQGLTNQVRELRESAKKRYGEEGVFRPMKIAQEQAARGANFLKDYAVANAQYPIRLQ